MTRRRYLYRVVVAGTPVRHYQSLAAAQYRACEWSDREGYQGQVIRVERSEPIEFDGAQIGMGYRYGEATR